MRDRQRAWCPRCRGQLLAPAEAPPPHAANRPPNHAGGYPSRQAGASRLGSGFRWIAVRPGPPPPPRRRPRPLGPTPRYRTIPRWGLVDHGPPPPPGRDQIRRTPSDSTLRAALFAAAAVFAVAAAAHVLRYVLLLINRNTLLHPLVANGVLLMGVLASLAAIAAVIAAAVVATSWLIGRRAAVFGLTGRPDPRPEWELWAGCMVPVANLIWAPVFLIELARAEHAASRLQTPITTWWIAWTFSTAVSGWAIWTSSATEPQAVADNTVTVIIAYLAGLATVLLLLRVVDGFVRKPVARPAHRWVIVGGEPVPQDRHEPAANGDQEAHAGSGAGSRAESHDAVESGDREPAA